MKLHFNAASPFVRKVLVVAHEARVADRIELVSVATTPIDPDAGLAADNPLIKIPTLVLDDGTALYDSRVIAEYLADLGGTNLFPASGAARWTALRRQALADGLADAAVGSRYERFLRPPEKIFDRWVAGLIGKVRAALDAIEREASSLDGFTTIGEIAIACALGYLDFRYPEENWRTGRPAAAAFFASVADRPSMVASRPPQ